MTTPDVTVNPVVLPPMPVPAGWVIVINFVPAFVTVDEANTLNTVSFTIWTQRNGPTAL